MGKFTNRHGQIGLWCFTTITSIIAQYRSENGRQNL